MTEKELAQCLTTIGYLIFPALVMLCLFIAMLLKHRKDEKEWKEFMNSNKGSDEGSE